MDNLEDLKYQFIFTEIFQASINAAFSTRNHNYPIYIRNSERPKTLTTELKKLTEAYIIKFQSGETSEEDHFNEIVSISNIISVNGNYVDSLHKSRLRIGIVQKLLNLTLKYLWCMDIIKEPLHCPVDSIVINKIKPKISDILWTELDSIDEYRFYINAIREIANNESKSIAKWELDIWNRRSLDISANQPQF